MNNVIKLERPDDSPGIAVMPAPIISADVL